MDCESPSFFKTLTLLRVVNPLVTITDAFDLGVAQFKFTNGHKMHLSIVEWSCETQHEARNFLTTAAGHLQTPNSDAGATRRWRAVAVAAPPNDAASSPCQRGQATKPRRRSGPVK